MSTEPGTGEEQASNYPTRYVRCNACFGTGEDRHGRGDCIECNGYGDIETARE